MAGRLVITQTTACPAGPRGCCLSVGGSPFHVSFLLLPTYIHDSRIRHLYVANIFITVCVFLHCTTSARVATSTKVSAPAFSARRAPRASRLPLAALRLLKRQPSKCSLVLGGARRGRCCEPLHDAPGCHLPHCDGVRARHTRLAAQRQWHCRELGAWSVAGGQVSASVTRDSARGAARRQVSGSGRQRRSGFDSQCGGLRSALTGDRGSSLPWGRGHRHGDADADHHHHHHRHGQLGRRGGRLLCFCDAAA